MPARYYTGVSWSANRSKSADLYKQGASELVPAKTNCYFCFAVKRLMRVVRYQPIDNHNFNNFK